MNARTELLRPGIQINFTNHVRLIYSVVQEHEVQYTPA